MTHSARSRVGIGLVAITLMTTACGGAGARAVAGLVSCIIRPRDKSQRLLPGRVMTGYAIWGMGANLQGRGRRHLGEGPDGEEERLGIE